LRLLNLVPVRLLSDEKDIEELVLLPSKASWGRVWERDLSSKGVPAKK
jgi:hypothetical protein